jgi:hypothetical protein
MAAPGSKSRPTRRSVGLWSSRKKPDSTPELAPETSAKSVASEVLVALQGVLTRAAIGAARTAVRLGGIALRHETMEAHAREVQDITIRVRADSEAAALAATRTADASKGVATLARDGRKVSSQSTESMRQLLQHSDLTNARLGSLLERVREATGVSRLIDDIATRTRLLAGFQIHVPKPVEPDELVAVVATLTGRTGSRPEGVAQARSDHDPATQNPRHAAL